MTNANFVQWKKQCIDTDYRKKTTGNKGAFTKVVWAYGKGITMSSGTQTKMVLFWWELMGEAVGRTLCAIK